MTTHCRSAGHTETGKVRRRNEDAILIREDLGLWVVADGMGGHAAGDLASALIVERLGALKREGSVYEFVAAVEDSLQQVNAELRAVAVERQVDVIGSTVALLVHDQQFVLCGWVGDSRVYVQEKGGFMQLTRDHVHGQPGDVTHFGRRAPPGVEQPGRFSRRLPRTHAGARGPVRSLKARCAGLISTRRTFSGLSHRTGDFSAAMLDLAADHVASLRVESGKPLSEPGDVELTRVQARFAACSIGTGTASRGRQ